MKKKNFLVEFQRKFYKVKKWHITHETNNDRKKTNVAPKKIRPRFKLNKFIKKKLGFAAEDTFWYFL